MKIKKWKNLKRVISACIVTVMVMSSLSVLVSANDTTNAEVAFSLNCLNSLPKKGENNFDVFLKLPNENKMNEKRDVLVKHKDRPDENISVPEKTVYKEIFAEVKKIENMVDGETTGYNAPDNSGNMSREMKIAGEIYKWVAENIKYDFESLDLNLKKPQDALFVYNQKMGVCTGKADLTALMMKIAKIPAAFISSNFGKDGMGHAYNAIYLEENNANNRSGWTLLDSTWGAPKSDKEPEATDEYRINQLIKGRDFPWREWIYRKFNRNDEYAKEISKILDFDPFEINDIQIKDLNNKMKSKLEELNSKLVDGFKFKEIKFYKNKNEKFLQVEYETNLKPHEAAQIVNEIIKRDLKNQIEETRVIEDVLFGEGLTKLNPEILNSLKWLDGLSENKLKRHETYSKEVTEICETIFKEFEKQIENTKSDQNKLKETIRLMNEKINLKLSELSKKFGDIITFKAFDIFLTDYAEFIKKDGEWAMNVKAETPLTFDEAKEIVEKDKQKNKKMVELERLKKYFPSFYDIKLDFKAANEKIIKETEHKVRHILNYGVSEKTDSYYDCFYSHEFKIEGVKYELDGREGSSHIVLRKDWDEKPKVIRISPDIANFGMTFMIGVGIESIALEGDTAVDGLSNNSWLRSVDITNSTRYEKRDNKLFDKILNKEVETFFSIRGFDSLFNIIDNRAKK